jgi:ATP-dependent 26S proteasome regulatory subunit
MDEGHVELIQQEFHKTPLRKDVAGKAGTFIDDFLLAKDSEAVYSSMGVAPDKTFLLAGVPGTGKTLATQALNNEANNNFRKDLEAITEENKARKRLGEDLIPCTAKQEDIGLLMFPYDIGKFGTAYINRGSLMVQNFFDQVGIYAQYGVKTVVVLDEADAVLGSRKGSTQSHAEDKKVLETIMKNLQLVHDTPNMYAILMTNYAEACDDAALRAGRIDKQYVFELPNFQERVEGFNLAAQQINDKATYSVIRSYDNRELAKLSEGFSYADIMEASKSAVKQRAQEIARERTELVIPAGYVTQKRLVESVNKHKKMFNKGNSKSKLGFGE